MPVRKLKEFLDQNGVRWVSIVHSPAYTAQEVAASAHVKGKELAKTVMVKVDGKPVMVVLPASQRVDFQVLREVTGGQNVVLASEAEFRELFPDCEAGAMPPFGNLYGMDVYVAPKLSEDDEIVFNAGSHTELMKLRYADFEARPAGIRAMLPWVDEFLPVHNLVSLEALADILAKGAGSARVDPTRPAPGRGRGRRASSGRIGSAPSAGGAVSPTGRR